MARNGVLGAMGGFNSTVFAYGQTGSGKTFTITGGTERYKDRGIIPRALSTLYAEVAKNSEFSFTLHISYLEIYNEAGRALAARPRPLPKGRSCGAPASPVAPAQAA